MREGEGFFSFSFGGGGERFFFFCTRAGGGRQGWPAPACATTGHSRPNRAHHAPQRRARLPRVRPRRPSFAQRAPSKAAASAAACVRVHANIFLFVFVCETSFLLLPQKRGDKSVLCLFLCVCSLHAKATRCSSLCPTENVLNCAKARSCVSTLSEHDV